VIAEDAREFVESLTGGDPYRGLRQLAVKHTGGGRWADEDKHETNPPTYRLHARTNSGWCGLLRDNKGRIIECDYLDRARVRAEAVLLARPGIECVALIGVTDTRERVVVRLVRVRVEVGNS
jgi:hypothetical protein